VPKPVVFLDRDGVINRDSPDYIKGIAEFVFLPGSLEALRRLSRDGFLVIVVTNQSAVNRGLITPAGLERLHAHLRAGVAAAGGRIDDILFCPHRPGEGCVCRKPEPGLLLEAQLRHGVDFRRSVMVGDSARDILCARAAGCRYTVLVNTGNGHDAAAQLLRLGIRPDHRSADLRQAARWIVDTRHRERW
jgi:D-glycero-D-manno-heptose 1,7-bisphosphate phosphatase